MALFTVLGGSSFFAAHLARHLATAGEHVVAPGRDEPLRQLNLGHVVYCVEPAAEIRHRGTAIVDAHVWRLAEILRSKRFESFLYLSSAAVYKGADAGSEDSAIALRPEDPADLHSAVRLAGESLCLATPNAAIRVARLSNVYGAGAEDHADCEAPLGSLARDAAKRGLITLGTTLDSTSDYIWIEDVVQALHLIALQGRSRLYNVASGACVRLRDIVNEIRRATGASVVIEPDAVTVSAPAIDVTRLAAEFERCGKAFAPADVLGRLPDILSTHLGVRRSRAGGKL